MDNLVVQGERGFRAAGRRLTPQRALVLRLLSQAEGHQDARDLYARARQQDWRLSLATVYRTLTVLKELGLVRELHLDEEHHHYELDAKDGHSHLVCLGCGLVIEVDSAAFAGAATAVAAQHSFQIAGAVVEFTGFCADCAQRARERSATAPLPMIAGPLASAQADGIAF